MAYTEYIQNLCLKYILVYIFYSFHQNHISNNDPYLSDCNWTRTHNQLVCKGTLNHLAKLARWLSVRLQTNWLWVWLQLQSLKLQILCLLQARSFLTFRQLYSADSLGNMYMAWQEHTVSGPYHGGTTFFIFIWYFSTDLCIWKGTSVFLSVFLPLFILLGELWSFFIIYDYSSM